MDGSAGSQSGEKGCRIALFGRGRHSPERPSSGSTPAGAGNSFTQAISLQEQLMTWGVLDFK